MNGHGGKRAGAGKPKGHKSAATLSKIEAREALRRQVTAELEPLIKAQISNAKGLSYLVARNEKTGKFERVTSAMLEAEGTDHERIEVWEKDPSVQAFTDLLNRALDKPTDIVEMNVTTTEGRERRLQAAKARAAKR